MIRLEFTNEDDGKKVFERKKIFLQDQVNVLENLAKLEERSKANDKLQAEIEEYTERVQEANVESDEGIELIEQYNRKLQEIDAAIREAHLEIIKVYAEIMVKLFHEEFTKEEFLQGMETDFRSVCDDIIAQVLGGSSDDEKK